MLVELLWKGVGDDVCVVILMNLSGQMEELLNH